MRRGAGKHRTMRKQNSWPLDQFTRGTRITHITQSLAPLRRHPLLRSLLVVVALGAALIATLFVTGVAGAALAKVGIGGSGRPDPSQLTTPMMINGVPTFPTPTLPAWRSGPTPPAAALPNSQTPVPDATPSPTPDGDATPQPSPPGAGTGTPAPTTCKGSAPGASWALSTCPPAHGQPITLSIVARSYPNAGTNIVLNFGNCGGCTLLLTPQQGYHLDGSGHESATVTVPAAAANSSVPVGGMINIAGGPSLSISAAPVR
jgi:hypothetical protein